MIKTKNALKLIFYTSLSLLSFQSLAQNDKWETWHDKIPVSGGVRVGLMHELEESTHHKITRPNEFYVWSSDCDEINTESIEIEISSKDGRYSAKFNGSNLSSKGEPLAGLIQPIIVNNGVIYKVVTLTQYENQLKDFNRDEIVILTSIVDKEISGSAEKEKKRKYLVSSWDIYQQTKGSNEKDSIAVYVNSQIPTRLKYQEGENELEAKEVTCIELAAPAIAFNKKCIIPNKQFIISDILYIKQRVRRLGQTKISRYELRIK